MENIVCLQKCPSDGDITGYDGQGWYFYDEAYSLHGPFDTKEETEEILKKYIKEYL